MNKSTKDTTTLKGEELFHHLTNNGDDYSSLVALLPYAMMDRNKALLFLEDMVKNGKRIVSIYPGNGEVVPSGAELVGAIPDGALYLI